MATDYIQIFQGQAKLEKTVIDTGDVNAFLLEADDVGTGLDRCKLDVEQIVRFVANFTQLRHTARGCDRCFHVQRTRTCFQKHMLQTAAACVSMQAPIASYLQLMTADKCCRFAKNNFYSIRFSTVLPSVL